MVLWRVGLPQEANREVVAPTRWGMATTRREAMNGSNARQMLPFNRAGLLGGGCKIAFRRVKAIASLKERVVVEGVGRRRRVLREGSNKEKKEEKKRKGKKNQSSQNVLS